MPVLEPTITIGNLVTIIGGLVSVIALWVRLGDRVDMLQRDQARQSATLDEMSKLGLITNQTQHERRIQAIEETLKDFMQLRTDIRWIKQALRGGGPPEVENNK